MLDFGELQSSSSDYIKILQILSEVLEHWRLSPSAPPESLGARQKPHTPTVLYILVVTHFRSESNVN